MSRGPREQSEYDLYHIMVRGSGRMTLFEDEDDRKAYLRALLRCKRDARADVLAWCIMGNHAYFVLHAELADVARLMQRMNGSYAIHYNNKYEHPGGAFQGRYESVAIKDEIQLLSCIRYVHQNPVKAHLATSCGDYRWSSYREYLGVPGLGDDYVCDTSYVLETFGSEEAFVNFHGEEDSLKHLDCEEEPEEGDSLARRRAEEAVGAKALREMARYPRAERNECLLRLQEAGLTVRQVERICGVGRGIVWRVWKGAREKCAEVAAGGGRDTSSDPA